MERSVVQSLSLRAARRLALARSGFLGTRWSGLPARARGRGRRSLAALEAVVARFGYLQLDTVAVAGARSHALVLLARLEGLDASWCEQLLRPGGPFFEYWGHEASWMPLDLYPTFEFRRRQFSRRSPWWGDLMEANTRLANEILARIRAEGPLRSADLEGASGQGWWELKTSKKVAMGLWFAGRLAIRERVNFQRTYDLPERVIPAELLSAPQDEKRALETLLLRALSGHGFATLGTLAATWRLRNLGGPLKACLADLQDRNEVLPCVLIDDDGRAQKGFVRPCDLELAARLERARPRGDLGVLLSPFDPLLWDRARVRKLFGFHALLEIFKPAAQRQYGYYCLPVLAGERLVARFDLKAERAQGRLEVLAWHFEGPRSTRPLRTEDGEAARVALQRHAEALDLGLRGGPRL